MATFTVYKRRFKEKGDTSSWDALVKGLKNIGQVIKNGGSTNDELKKKLEDLQKHQSDITSQIQDIQNDIKELKDKKSEHSVSEEVDDLKQQKKKLPKMDDIDDNDKKYPDADSKAKEKEKIKVQKEKIDKEIEKLQKEGGFDKIDTAIEALQGDIDNLKQAKLKVRDMMDEIREILIKAKPEKDDKD